MGGESWVANNHQTCHPSCNTTTSAAPRISSSRGIWPQIKRSRPEPRMKSRRTRGRYVPELRPTIIYTRGVRKIHIQRAIRKICFPRFSIKKKDVYVKSSPSSHPFLLRRDRHTSHSIRTWRTQLEPIHSRLANSPILNGYRDVSRDDKGNGFKDLVSVSRFSGFRGRRRGKRKISF